MAETVKTPVTMTDGRIVEFSTKQKLVKTSDITEAGDITVRLDFRNGETRSFSPRSDMIAKFAAHGIEQKLGDCIAGEVDPDDQVLAVEDLIKRLDAGEWNVGRASGGGFGGTSVLLRALVEASGKSAEDIKTYLSTKTQADKLALRNSDKLRPIVQRLEAEKQKNSKTAVDTDALLGELGLDVTVGKKAKAE